LGLATITFPSATVYSTSILFSMIGVPTLLLTTFGLLNRVYLNLAKNYPTRIKARYFSLLQFPFQVAIVIIAKGASNSTADISNSALYHPQIWTKVGIMLCVAGFFVMAILTFAMVRRQEHTTPTEHRLLHTIIRSLPFLFIRLMYTILVTFMDRNVFRSYGGNVLVIGLMAILPEMIVVIIYMVEGFTLPKLEKDKKKQKKCRRKKGGWPERPEVLDDVSITRADSAAGWKDLDDKSSCSSQV
jgi:hypothetical protein